MQTIRWSMLLVVALSCMLLLTAAHGQDKAKTTRKAAVVYPSGGWGEQFRWSFADPIRQAELKRHRVAMVGLNLAYDNDGLWNWGEPKEEAPQTLRKMVDQYADAGAKFIVWGCGGYSAWSYTPKVQDQWGVKLTKEARDKHPGYVKAAKLFHEHLDAGTDPLAMVLARAKARKLPVLAGFRDTNRYDYKVCPDSWFVANPKFHLSPKRNPWYPDEMGVNFALDEVREHKVRVWTDVVERYDVDGLHLEFMRSLPFFEKDEPDKIKHMNALIAALRSELDRIGEKRGKRLKLAIWLPTPQHMRRLRGMFPADFFDLKAQGLDPETWIRQGWVDVLMPSIYAPDLRMPKAGEMPPWVKTAKGTQTKVYACVMNLRRGGATDSQERAHQILQIMQTLSGQYDGIFLFNSQPYQVAAMMELAAP